MRRRRRRSCARGATKPRRSWRETPCRAALPLHQRVQRRAKSDDDSRPRRASVPRPNRRSVRREARASATSRLPARAARTPAIAAAPQRSSTLDRVSPRTGPGELARSAARRVVSRTAEQRSWLREARHVAGERARSSTTSRPSMRSPRPRTRSSPGSQSRCEGRPVASATEDERRGSVGDTVTVARRSKQRAAAIDVARAREHGANDAVERVARERGIRCWPRRTFAPAITSPSA